MAATVAVVTDRAGNGTRGKLVLRLYVAGDAPNSARARANLRRLLEPMDPNRYELEVIDCFEEPLRALNDGVLVTPTLLKVEPAPHRTVVGSLSARDMVADALEIETIKSPAEGAEASHE